MDYKEKFIKADKDVNKEANASDKLANLKSITELDNNISFVEGNLVVSTANESHVKEVAELWANLASIQQMYAP